METLKLVITGAMGAGKTSAIGAISSIPPVTTEASTFQEISHHASKNTTTVAMDYGELMLNDGRILMIVGTPGQSRYDFMCTILAQGALGIIILIDHTAPDPAGDLRYFLQLYESILPVTPCVVGVTHTDESPNPALDPYLDVLEDRVASIPVFALDARSSEDIITVLQCLLAILETAALLEESSC